MLLPTIMLIPIIYVISCVVSNSECTMYSTLRKILYAARKAVRNFATGRNFSPKNLSKDRW